MNKPARKAYLLRVGADSGEDGGSFSRRSPLFSDGSFEFIPISSEEEDCVYCRRFAGADLTYWNTCDESGTGKPLGKYLEDSEIMGNEPRRDFDKRISYTASKNLCQLR